MVRNLVVALMLALLSTGTATAASGEPSGKPRRVLPLAAIGPAVRRLLGLKFMPSVADAQAEA